VFWYATGPLKVRVSLCSQNGSPPPPKPLQKPWFICQHIATAQFSQWCNAVGHRACLVSRLPCSSLWVEISTLAYLTNCSCWPERFSGILYPYNSDKTNAQKPEISTKIDVWTASRKEHKYSSFCRTSKRCEKKGGPTHQQRQLTTVCVDVYHRNFSSACLTDQRVLLATLGQTSRT